MKAVVMHKKKSTLRIDYYLLYIVVIAPFLLPYCFIQMDSLYAFKHVITYVSLIIMAVFILFNLKTIKMPVFLLGFWYMILVFSTFLCDGEIGTACKHAIKVILFCLNMGVIIKDKDKQYSFFCAVRDWSVVFFLINLVITYNYPMGVPDLTTDPEKPYFLYGNINSTIKYILPAMCCTTLLDIKKEKMSVFMSVFMGGLIYIYIVSYHMATALMALIVITVWFILKKRMQTNLKIVYLTGVLVIFIMEILLVIISNTDFMAFIAQLFGKDADFSGRLFLWKRIIFQIVQKPWSGYGLQSEITLLNKIGNPYGSHNYYLDLIYQRGRIGIFIFIILILLPALRLKRSSHISDSLYALTGYWFAFMVMFLTEPFYEWEYVFIPLLYAIILLSGEKRFIKT